MRLFRSLLLAFILAPLAGCEEAPLDPATMNAASRALLEEARRAAASGTNDGATAPRLGGLEREYGAAIAHVADEQGAERAAALLQRRERFLDAARSAARAGHRSAAQNAFEAARREQIRVVLDVLGVEHAAEYMARVEAAADRASADIVRGRTPAVDGSTHERMLRSASELLIRAQAAWDVGDAATALDLAAHAAGLVDTIAQRLTDG